MNQHITSCRESHSLKKKRHTCRKDSKYLDRYALANSADPDQTYQSDQDLHFLPFHLHVLYNCCLTIFALPNQSVRTVAVPPIYRIT